MYHSATNGTKDFTDIEIGVSCRAATTMPSRKVMARKRTRPSQGSHSLTLVADFMLRSLPVPLTSPAGSLSKIVSSGEEQQMGSPAMGDPHQASRLPGLLSGKFSDQREQRQIHGDNDSAHDHAQHHD